MLQSPAFWLSLLGFTALLALRLWWVTKHPSQADWAAMEQERQAHRREQRAELEERRRERWLNDRERD